MILTSGCSSKYADSISDIKDKKLLEKQSDIKTSFSSDFIVYIDKSDRIKYICKNEHLYNYSDNQCGYYDTSKHSYDNLVVQEEVFGISKDGYNPLRMPHKTKCGVGSPYGWLAIFMMESYAIKDYTSRDREGCGYRYTKVDDTLIMQRVVGGIYTFGTSFITGANLHIREFDKEAFISSIHSSRIDTYKDEIYKATAGYNIDGGFNIIYLEEGSYTSDLEDAYETLLKDKTKKAGFIFLDDDTKELISIVVFDKYRDTDLIASLSLQIGDVIDLEKRKNLSELKNSDIIKQIPQEIFLPKLPKISKLDKNEFETKAAFEKRVKDAKIERESSIENLQKEYSSNVLNRNRYIEELQASYQEYLDDMVDAQYETIKELQDSIPSLAKLLFLGNISGYEAKSFEYNAETEQLFFNISSKNRGYSQDVVATVSPSSAKNIKETQNFKILSELVYENSKLQLKGFEIVDTVDNDSYMVSYTDINYIPKKIVVKVVAQKELIVKEASLAFKNAKQKDMSIVDNTNKETWYIDVVNRVDTESPKWYSKREHDSSIAYGEGDTFNEAKKCALDELAMKINVIVDISYESSETISNFKNTAKREYKSKHSSKVELNSTDYKIEKRVKVGERHYVSLRYLK